MATIVRKKTTGEFFFMWGKFATNDDVCEYALYHFDGTVFHEIEHKTTTHEEYICFMNGFDNIEEAPPMTIFEKDIDVVFWNDYFKRLKTGQRRQSPIFI